MKYKLLAMLAAFLAAACVLAGNDEAVKKISGSWVLTFDEKLSFYKLVISEDKGYSWKDRSGVEKGTLSIDPTKTPLAIDFHVTQGPLKGKTKKGIYKVEQVKTNVSGRARDVQRLTTCIAVTGFERPSQFSRDEGALTVWFKQVTAP